MSLDVMPVEVSTHASVRRRLFVSVIKRCSPSVSTHASVRRRRRVPSKNLVKRLFQLTPP